MFVFRMQKFHQNFHTCHHMWITTSNKQLQNKRSQKVGKVKLRLHQLYMRGTPCPCADSSQKINPFPSKSMQLDCKTGTRRKTSEVNTKMILAVKRNFPWVLQISLSLSLSVCLSLSLTHKHKSVRKRRWHN
jgi:hypothetical protein